MQLLTDQPTRGSPGAMSTDVADLLAKAAQRKARAVELGASLSESSTPRTVFLALQLKNIQQDTESTIVTRFMG